MKFVDPFGLFRGVSPPGGSGFPRWIEKQIEDVINDLINDIVSKIPCVDCDLAEIIKCTFSSANTAIICTKCGVCLDLCMLAGELAPIACLASCSRSCGMCAGRLSMKAGECVWDHCDVGTLDPCTGKCKT